MMAPHRGEQYDPDLGLYYLRARYYNPITGRFMGRDPEDGKPTDPRTLHKYLYAGGDPVNAMDPTGRGVVEFTRVLVTTVVEDLTLREVGVWVDCLLAQIGGVIAYKEHSTLGTAVAGAGTAVACGLLLGEMF